ncbi:MAG: FecR domain-containing protein [Methyloceanibacter sp.]
MSLGLAFAAPGAHAEKVGVAAAVNPDAFSSLAGSPQSQLNIGKSIFYNERINTTGNGLVQVLLVDGSTFTVGPGSDLVIDRFVYDPRKGTGELTASFSKGVMRFVGGKLSKNDGGVTVKTPAGALAIRGGIAFVDFKSATTYSILFVYGEYLKMQGKTIFEPGYGFFSNGGQMVTKPFTPQRSSPRPPAKSRAARPPR